MRISPQDLAAAVGMPRSRAEVWAPRLTPAFALAEINTLNRLVDFLAQTGHETLSYFYLRELWGKVPTKAQARYEPTTTLSRRLGNFRPGDGKLFMGRGLIQTTGGANYTLTTKGLRSHLGSSVPDFFENPHLLATPEWAALSAALFWKSKRLNTYSDECDFLTLTKRINGGTHGLADRTLRRALAYGTLNGNIE